MTVRVTKDKCDHIKALCKNILSKKFPTIREVSKLIGTMISYIHGAEYGQLHYRYLENCKIAAVWDNWGDYDSTMELDSKSVQDVNLSGRVTFRVN